MVRCTLLCFITTLCDALRLSSGSRSRRTSFLPSSQRFLIPAAILGFTPHECLASESFYEAKHYNEPLGLLALAFPQSSAETQERVVPEAPSNKCNKALTLTPMQKGVFGNLINFVYSCQQGREMIILDHRSHLWLFFLRSAFAFEGRFQAQMLIRTDLAAVARQAATKMHKGIIYAAVAGTNVLRKGFEVLECASVRERSVEQAPRTEKNKTRGLRRYIKIRQK